MIATVSQEELDNHKIVSQAEWLDASAKLVALEKEWSRRRDELNKLRRELPWVKVDKNYVFDGPSGRQTLADLFDGRSQLITYHFMSNPTWDDACPGCSFIADHMDGANLHLPHNDVTLVVVSRAPFDAFTAYKERMGWKFPWVSSLGSDFNYDYNVSFKRADLDSGDVLYNFKMQKLRSEEQPGVSAFYKNPAGEIFHTYSSYDRGLDILIGANSYLDLTAKGRNESSTMSWVRLHDEY